MKFFTKLLAGTLSVCLFVVCPMLANAQAPANDLCANATEIFCGQGPYLGSNATATSTGDPTASCAGGGATPGPYGVWFKYTGTGDRVSLTTCHNATEFDTKLYVYTGGCGGLTCIVGNDDVAGCSPTSQVVFNSILGTEYLILLTGWGTGDNGAYGLRVGCGTLPANDLCANAATIACGSTVQGSNVAATTTGDPTSSCAGGGGSPGTNGVWYQFAGDGSVVTLSTCNASTTYDTKLHVYTGSCGSFTCIAGNDDAPVTGCGGTSQVTFASVTGTTYYVLLSAYDGIELGYYGLSATCAAPPANDACAGALPISCASGTVYGSNTNATSAGNPTTCGTAPGDASVWYTFVGTGEHITLSTCDSSNFNTKLNVYSGVCGTLTCVTGNDDNTACTGRTNRSEVKLNSVLGTTYYVVVSGLTTANGNFGLAITCRPTYAVNDSCINAIAVNCTTGTVTGTTANATGNGDPTASCGGVAPGNYGVWYTFTGTGDGITLSTCSANTVFDTRLNVYSGSACGSLTCVTGNDNTTGCGANASASSVSFNSVNGTQYYVLVSGTSGANGAFNLNITCTPPPANDLCANAAPLTCGTTVSGTTVGATTTGNPTTGCNSINPSTTPGVWYTYTGTGNYTVFSTCNAASFDTRINIYTGTCGTFTCVTANDNYASACSNNSSRVGIPTVTGTTYYVLITGASGAIGSFSLSTTCFGPNTNAIDSCAGSYTRTGANDTINNTMGIARDTLIVAANPLDTITDLNLIVELRHTYVGDLVVVLKHVPTGTLDTIINRPLGVGAACQQNDINAKFDDSAFKTIICGPVDHSDSSALKKGPYQPFRPLSVFNGQTIGGPWELMVTDGASGDNGRLLNWCLEPTLRPYACTNPLATFRDSCNPANSAFFVIVDVTDLGNAPSLAITNSDNATIVTANGLGSYVVGPFTPGTLVDITLTNTASNTCVLVETGRTSNCIIQTPCVNPAATISAYCNPTDGSNFYVDVVVTDIGSGPALTISNSLNATTTAVTAAGTYTVGPFANSAVVDVTLENDTASGCNVTALALTRNCTPICTTGVFAGRDTTICAGQPVQLGDLATAPLMTVQSENFNGCALPAGWTRTALQGTANWLFSIPSYGGSGAIDGTCLAHFNDDLAGNGVYNIIALTSPPIDLSSYISAELSLDLHYYHRNWNNQYPSSFEIQVWDGTAYQVLQNYQVQVTGTTWASFSNVTFNLTPYLNAALHIRFLYDDGNGWNQWVGFDNFEITVTGSSSGTYAWAPSAGLSDATSSVPVATPTTTTTYTVEHVDGLCTYRDTVVVTVNQLPTVALAGAADEYCITDTDPVQLFGLPAGGTFAGSGVSGSTFTPSAAGAGVKILTYTYSDGTCSNVARDTVEVFAQPTAALSAAQPTYCIFDAPVTLTATPTGGTLAGAGVSGTSFDPALAGSGNHTLTYIYQSPATGCSDTAFLTLTVVDVAVTFNAPGGPYCADDTNRVTLSVSPAGGTFIGPGVTNGQFRPSAAGPGTHTLVYVVDSFIDYSVQNCTFTPLAPSGTPTFLAMGDDVLSSAITLPFNFKFYGQSYSQIKISSNGWITFDLGLTTSFPLNAAMPNAAAPNNIIAGKWVDLWTYGVAYYTLGTAPNRQFVIDYDSENYWDEETVLFQIVLHETSNEVQIICIECPEDMFNIFVPGGTQGLENATGTQAITPQGRNYQIWNAFGDCQRFVPNSCTFSETQDVTVNPTPTANAGNDTSICLGGTATLTATGGTSYLWNNGQTTAAINVSPTNTTSYNVRVTDANGCTDRDTVVVSILPTPVVNLQDPTICQGSNTTLDAGNPGATYVWSTGDQTQTLTVNTAGNYIVTVTIGSCTDVDTATVTISTSLTVNLGNPGICPGDTATLNAGNPGASYVWSTQEQSQTIRVNTPGTYSVTVTDANNCTGTGSTTVSLNPVPTVTLPDPTICVGSNTTLSAGNTGASFEWNTGDNTQSITVSNAGNYIVTVTNSFGCEGTDTSTVTVGTGLVVTLPNLSICPGDTATLDAGYPGSTYAWNTGASTQTIDVTTNGGFVVTVTDNSGCSGVGGGSVSLRIPEQVNAGTDTGVCPGGSVTLTATGNVASYQWTGGPATATYTVSPASATTYTVTGVDANGCATTDQVTVSINALPNASAGADAVACDGGSVTLTATGGTGYVWSNGAQTASTSVSPSSATTYTVTVTGANGCTATDAVNVTIASLPTVSISTLDSVYCVSDPVVTLSGTPTGGTFSGVGVTGNTFNPAIGQNGLNVITYSYTDANGCTGTADVKFNVTYCPGIDEPIMGESVKVYPNPFSNEIFVSFDAAYEHVITVNLRNMLGQTISQQQVQIVAGSNEIRLEASENLAGGIYFVELQSLKENRSFKLVKVMR